MFCAYSHVVVIDVKLCFHGKIRGFYQFAVIMRRRERKNNCDEAEDLGVSFVKIFEAFFQARKINCSLESTLFVVHFSVLFVSVSPEINEPQN